MHVEERPVLEFLGVRQGLVTTLAVGLPLPNGRFHSLVERRYRQVFPKLNVLVFADLLQGFLDRLPIRPGGLRSLDK
jgi:hypothetical protein